MAKLLREYNDVSYSGNHDVGLTRAVRHEVPLVAGAVPIRQPTRKLGPKKERKDRGSLRSELETLDHPEIEYDWDQGQLPQRAGTLLEVVKNSAPTLFWPVTLGATGTPGKSSRSGSRRVPS